VISCVTSAKSPVLRGAWLKPGTHVDLIGAHQPDAREADSDLIAAAHIWADVRANVLREAGDILIPIDEGRITAAAIRGELADIVDPAAMELRGDDAITVFKSVGFAAEDMIAALAAIDAALVR
jgi:1-pyrroline-2-carboxylate reductase [NAD(P)H]